MSKWTQAKALLGQARDAEAARRANRAADATAATAAARQQHANERAEAVTKATGPDGVIRSSGATWDGRLLTVLNGHVVPPRGKKKLVWAAVTVPRTSITSASWAAGRVHVTVTDGREFHFSAPRAMADAITTALAG